MRKYFSWNQMFFLFFLLAGTPVVLAQSVVTEEEIPTPETPNVGYDNGFFIQSNDQDFKFTLTGKVRPKFQFSKDPQREATGGQLYRNTFSIRTASLGINVTLYKQLALDMTFMHATNASSFDGVNITGVTATYSPKPEFTVAAGMVGLPLDEGSGGVMTDSPITATQKDVVEAVTIARSSFGAPSGLGVGFAGDIQKFFYAFNIVNGSEDDYNFNRDWKASVGTRIGYNILGDARGAPSDFGFSEKPNVTISAGGLIESAKTDESVTPVPASLNHVVQASAGVSYKYMGFAFRTEGYMKQFNVEDPGSAVDLAGNKTDLGYYATVAYFFVPKKLEGVLMGSQIIRQGVANNSHQIGTGLNWYIKGKNLYLQTAYYFKKAYDRLAGQSYQNTHTFETILTAKF